MFPRVAQIVPVTRPLGAEPRATGGSMRQWALVVVLLLAAEVGDEDAGLS